VAIRQVRQLSGATEIDFVGHSLGGVILYMYLAEGGEGIRSAATLGSPARFRRFGRGASILRDLVAPLSQMLDTYPVDDLAHAIMPLHGEFRGPIESLLYNPENVRTSTWKKMIAVGEGTISGNVLRQALRWTEEDVFDSQDRKVDYAAGMKRIRTPILVVAGKLDRLAEPWSAKAAYERLAGPKEFFLAGVENGVAADYGHMDLILGDRAPQEIWALVENFLSRYDPS
jgi:pimeloyl-ACP methyl ester carboxylesterase